MLGILTKRVNDSATSIKKLIDPNYFVMEVAVYLFCV